MRRVADTRLAVKRRVAYPAVRIRPLNTEGAVGVVRRVADTRLAVKRRVAYPAVRIRPLNTEGAVGVMRRVANTRLAVKRRVAYLPCRHEYGPRTPVSFETHRLDSDIPLNYVLYTYFLPVPCK